MYTAAVPASSEALNGRLMDRTKNSASRIETGEHVVEEVRSKMVPVQISEYMSVVHVPNYEEKHVGSCMEVACTKRFHERVGLEPVLTPAVYRDSVICYNNCTRRRYLSHVLYEPRVRPRVFVETVFIYPRRPRLTFISAVDYHIDRCRRWFKTTVQLTAKTYTTTRIRTARPEAGASQVLLPRFPADQAVVALNGEIILNGPTNSDSESEL